MKKYLSIFLPVFIFIGITAHFGCKKSDTTVENPLWGARWVLISFQYPGPNILLVNRPFSLLFRQDGTVDIVVDCNACNGTYELGDNGALSFTGHMDCTEVFCGQDSQDDEFHAALDSASRYEIIGTSLRIYFDNEQSRLNFNAEMNLGN